MIKNLCLEMAFKTLKVNLIITLLLYNEEKDLQSDTESSLLMEWGICNKDKTENLFKILIFHFKII